MLATPAGMGRGPRPGTAAAALGRADLSWGGAPQLMEGAGSVDKEFQIPYLPFLCHAWMAKQMIQHLTGRLHSRGTVVPAWLGRLWVQASGRPSAYLPQKGTYVSQKQMEFWGFATPRAQAHAPPICTSSKLVDLLKFPFLSPDTLWHSCGASTSTFLATHGSGYSPGKGQH